ncbi:pantothenate kinase [Pseudomonas sp. rhizo66]|uniref:pantothenate kinase n=1 Tax=unclassified Pseudomonas TaxID=196821 RepID=UPI00202A19F8|nr:MULTISPECIES: pantothenate kinase [unclassified Pseudomonas]MCL9803860.1 pantothenate kinase [Pseudomonas sp. AKS31]MDT3311159.1 pantothenate kinase [Pseudomonas sp. rhizo66]
MILELDCGNSFIKWRVLKAALGALFSEGVVDSDLALIESLRALDGLVLRKCRLVSVRTAEETGALIEVIEREFNISVVCAKPAREMSGVKNGYEDYERLGLDRWLAMLGGFHLASRGACLVLDFGTAVTADFIAADGEHLGGFICPGMPLMRNQLRTHTRKIRYGDLAAERALSSSAPGRTTVEAVERGCSLMLRGFVLTQLEIARSYWGGGFAVFLTGGDAELVADVAPQARVVPDLVFVGLAMACPFS